MIVLRSEQYHKKMNLVGDLASYGCWAVHLRTPQLDVGVIAIRKSAETRLRNCALRKAHWRLVSRAMGCRACLSRRRMYGSA